MTYLITANDVQSVLTYPLSLKTVEAAFKAFGQGKTCLPPKSYLTFKDGDLRSMPAYINASGMNIAGIKSVNVHPDNHKKFGLPTVMATILLTDPKNGFNIAVLDGTHINGIGADAAGKQELETALTKSCKIVIDEWQQASHSGEINVPFSRGKLNKKNIYAELGEIVAGKKKGRTSDNEITLFDSTGLAIQDISTAFVVYQALMKKRKKPKHINLF